MAGGFQTAVGTVPAPGIEGDFCDANPRYATLAGPGALVAGPNGLTVGRFAWTTSPLDADNAPAIANNYGSGPVAGFVPRLQQGLITNFLADASMVIPTGFAVMLASSAGVWVKNNGATAAQIGQKAYANFVDGKATFAAAGAPTTASATSSAIAAGTAATGTGTIAGNVLTISGSANTVFSGAVVTGSGVATGTTIVSQINGTPGGDGQYYVDIPEQSVASTALTITPYVLDTTGGTVTGSIVTGSVIQSTGGTPTGTVVGTSVASTYAAGKYVIAGRGATATGGTVVLSSNVETSWYARSSGIAGELVKISNLPGIG